MSTICETVAERVALGQPLGDAADHAASCAQCRRLVALPAQLGATHRELDPGLGFSARMTAGAQHRIVQRRRRRIATGLVGVVAVAALGVFVVTRVGDAPRVAETPANPDQPATQPRDHRDPWKPHDGVDDDVRALVHLANVERSSHLSAHWGRIEKPVAAYRVVLAKGTLP